MFKTVRDDKDQMNFNKNDFLFICGPCAVESMDQMNAILNLPFAPTLVRGGIYKMRTNKNAFQGLGNVGIELIKELKNQQPMNFITEVTDPRQIDKLLPIVSCFQVGARNMYNYELLKELANYGLPVILKRGFSATISEWLGAAEYLGDLGEDKIILCERGVRSFDNKLRNLLDLGSVIYLKKNTKFKVIVDPSHAMGDRKYVPDASIAALAAGADGIIVEVHPDPDKALSDGQQSLEPIIANELVKKIKELAPHFNKVLRV
jgi:3-deoxy-7-phosphoheptulonate synthase